MNIEYINLFVAHSHGMNIEHMVVSSLIHGLTYGAIFKIFHNISPLAAGVIAIGVIGALWFYFGRRR